MNWDRTYEANRLVWGEEPGELAALACKHLGGVNSSGKVIEILDLGCGYGKLSLLMAEKGYDVYAVDNSQKILNSIKTNKFKKIFPGLVNSGKPITLLSTNSHNSLPASLEILYWTAKKGIKNTCLIHGSMDSIQAGIIKRSRHIQAAGTLNKMKIGYRYHKISMASEMDYIIEAKIF